MGASDPLEESIGVVHRPGSLGPKPWDGSITASPVCPTTSGKCAQRRACRPIRERYSSDRSTNGRIPPCR